MNSTFIPFTVHLHSTSINPFYPKGPWLPRLGAGRGQGIRGLLPNGRCLGGASWEVLVREAGFGLGAAGGDVGSFLTKKKGVEIERNMILFRLQKQIGELKRWSNVQNKFIFLSSAFKNKTWKSFKGRNSMGWNFLSADPGPPTIPNMANLGHPTRLFFWAGWVTVSVAKNTGRSTSQLVVTASQYPWPAGAPIDTHSIPMIHFPFLCYTKRASAKPIL